MPCREGLPPAAGSPRPSPGADEGDPQTAPGAHAPDVILAAFGGRGAVSLVAQWLRRAWPGSSASVTVMGVTIHGTFILDDDPDPFLTFHRDRPEVVPVVLHLLRAGPG